MKWPHGEGPVPTGAKQHINVYKRSIARKGKRMSSEINEMIRRKNEMLIRNGKRLEEINRIAREMVKANPGEPWLKLTVNSLGEKIERLTLWYDDMLAEGNICLLEAEGGTEEDLFLTLPTEEEITKAREENGDD